MKRKYRKKCKKCEKEFEGSGVGNCPYCGSGSWLFVETKEEVGVLTFTVPGNQEDPKGNPIPYLRMTTNEWRLLGIAEHKMRSEGARKKRAGVERYLSWKAYVERCCLYGAMIDGMPAQAWEVKKLFEMFALADKVQFDCMIFFANKAHGDPENVRKGCQDALFGNDKYVIGSVDFDYDSERPRVEVTIRDSGGKVSWKS